MTLLPWLLKSGNINQVCTSNMDKDGGKKEWNEQWDRQEMEGEGQQITSHRRCVCVCVRVRACVCLCEHVWIDVSFNEDICKGPWLYPPCHFYSAFSTPLSKVYFYSKRKWYSATIKARLAHICGMSSIQNSFHTRWTHFSARRKFISAAMLVDFLVLKCLLMPS